MYLLLFTQKQCKFLILVSPIKYYAYCLRFFITLLRNQDKNQELEEQKKIILCNMKYDFSHVPANPRSI